MSNLEDLHIKNQDIILLAETWAENEFMLPGKLQQEGFTSIQVNAIRESSHGRASGGLTCLFNKSHFQVVEMAKSKDYLIVNIAALKLIIIFVYFNLNLLL